MSTSFCGVVLLPTSTTTQADLERIRSDIDSWLQEIRARTTDSSEVPQSDNWSFHVLRVAGRQDLLRQIQGLELGAPTRLGFFVRRFSEEPGSEEVALTEVTMLLLKSRYPYSLVQCLSALAQHEVDDLIAWVLAPPPVS